MSPALNGSSTLERFERSNVSEIRNGIMFDSYPGLPHTLDIYLSDTTLITAIFGGRLLMQKNLLKALFWIV